MTSEERAVAQVAAEILRSHAAVELVAQVAVDTDQETLKLPAVVVSAEYEGEEMAVKIGGRYGGRFRLTAEARGIARVHDREAMDDVFGTITMAFTTSPPETPPSASLFNYYIILGPTGGDRPSDDEVRRESRSFAVVAHLA